tara:strand:+ start:538 stop:915 length:378 start_codon:yes stop_codon:yes gene_type:complete
LILINIIKINESNRIESNEILFLDEIFAKIKVSVINKFVINIIRKLNKLLPRIFPYAMLIFPILIHESAITSSGRLVDKAKNNVPVKFLFIPKPPSETLRDIISAIKVIKNPEKIIKKLNKIKLE